MVNTKHKYQKNGFRQRKCNFATPEEAFYKGYKQLKEQYIKQVADEYKDKMLELFTSSQELFNHLIVMCENHNWSYDCIWDIIGDDIIDIIPYGKTKVVIEDENGFEYLGHHYSLEEAKGC